MNFSDLSSPNIIDTDEEHNFEEMSPVEQNNNRVSFGKTQQSNPVEKRPKKSAMKSIPNTRLTKAQYKPASQFKL